MQSEPTALTKTIAHLNKNLVTARGAGGNLVQQFSQLRRTGHDLVREVEPMAQHIGLPRATQTLNLLDRGRRTNHEQILSRHVQQDGLRLGGIGGTASKGVTKMRK